MFVINSKRLSSWSLLFFISMYLLKVSFMEEVKNDVSMGEDTKRPFWNIAHMVNNIQQVDEYMDLGANSIEFDVYFNEDGIATHTYHGPPCDFNRSCSKEEDFVKYLKYLRKITSSESNKYGKKLVLLFMDVKVQYEIDTTEAWKTAGEDLALKLLDHYWQRGKSDARAYIIICIPETKYVDFLGSFINTMKNESGNFTEYEKMIGYDFSGNENLNETAEFYKTEFPEIQNIWQGDGKTNWCYRNGSRLRECIEIRDKSNETYIDKVYYWTVDKKSTMKQALRMGVDGMITNYPSTLNEVILKDSEFSKGFRLATIDDNPWEKYPVQSAGNMSRLMKGSVILRNLEDLTNITNKNVNIINLRDDL